MIARNPSARARLIQMSVLAVILGLASAGARAQGMPIPDLDVAGPAPEFEMDSRLMTSGKRMEVWLSIPKKGKAQLGNFNGTFFYRASKPEATTATLMFRADQFNDVEGSIAKELIEALDFDRHPFFAFQSRSASKTRKGVDLKGKLIVKDRESTATLQLKSPGKVAINDKAERWIAMKAVMEVSTADLGLDSLGKSIRFDFDVFLFNFTIDSVKQTGIDPAALDEDPPSLPSDADALSNAGWYLIYTKRFDEAIKAFDKSIEAKGAISAYLRRGDAYVFDGQYGKAMGTYKAMAQYMPTHPHLLELRKVLDGEYLTPSTLSVFSRMWQEMN